MALDSNFLEVVPPVHILIDSIVQVEDHLPPEPN